MGAFHASWAWVVIVSNGLAGIWALAAHWVEPARVKQLWWFAYGAQASIAIQATTGAIRFQADGVEIPEIHLFYGFVALASVAVIYSYRAQTDHFRYLFYGFGSLFLMGLGIRSMTLVS